jgi:MFS family permease
VRALWSRTDPRFRGTAYALDAVANELVFVVGPTLVAVLSVVAGAAAAVAVAGALGVIGTVGIATTPALRGWRPEPQPATRLLGTVLTPGMPRLLASDFALMTGFGALEVAIPAFASAAGRPGLSGLLLAVWSLGSVGGGLWFGARVLSVSLPRQYRWGLLGVTIGLVPLAVVSSPWVLAALLFLGGTAIAPTLTVQNNLVGAIAPAHATTEAFTWLSTIAFGASAVGAALAGALIDSTWGLPGALGASAVMAALAVAITLVPGRRPQRPAVAPAASREDVLAA